MFRISVCIPHGRLFHVTTLRDGVVTASRAGLAPLRRSSFAVARQALCIPPPLPFQTNNGTVALRLSRARLRKRQSGIECLLKHSLKGVMRDPLRLSRDTLRHLASRHLATPCDALQSSREPAFAATPREPAFGRRAALALPHLTTPRYTLRDP